MSMSRNAKFTATCEFEKDRTRRISITAKVGFASRLRDCAKKVVNVTKEGEGGGHRTW